MNFTKMHGLGNDFIILENVKDDVEALAKKLCHRQLGVGADGLLIVEPSHKADICMRIINADGSEAEMCGNGVRCFAKYVYDKGIVKKQNMEIETLAGIMRPHLILKDGVVEEVCVDMGKPVFEAENIPVLTKDPMDFAIDCSGRQVHLSTILLGVPHTVLLCRDIEKADILGDGPLIETNNVFPKKTNVNFVQVKDENTIAVRTWERGAGATMACGTGACSSVVVCNKKGLVGNKVTVELLAGNMTVEIDGHGTVLMTGPAAYVFCGETI